MPPHPMWFPDTTHWWWSIREPAYQGPAPCPFSASHAEIVIPIGTPVWVDGTWTPVFITGNTGSISANDCASITAFVDLRSDGDRAVEHARSVNLENVGFASVVLLNERTVRFQDVEELNVAIGSRTDGSTKDQGAVRIKGTSYLRTHSVNRDINVASQPLIANVVAHGRTTTTFEAGCRTLRSNCGTGTTSVVKGGATETLFASGPHALVLDGAKFR